MSKQKIIDFLKILCPVGKVEFNNLDKVFDFEEAIKFKGNVYFLASVNDNKKRNGDKDITFKNYFYVDFDLRENRKKKKGVLLDDIAMELQLDFIKQRLQNNGYGDWRFIVNTGNGFHFYRVGNGNSFGIDEYKLAIEYYYKIIDDIFDDDAYKVDHACKNIGRIARLPGSMNYGRKDKYGLDISEALIIEDTGISSEKIGDIPTIAKNMKDNETKENLQKQMKNISDPCLEIILELNIVPIIEEYTGLELGKDKRNFPDKNGNTGMFVSDNILFWTGTARISDKFGGYNTFTFVREHYKLDNNGTFQRFKDRYPQVKDISTKIKKEYKQELKTKDIGKDIWIEKNEINIKFGGYRPSWGLEYIDKELRKFDVNGELVVLYGPPGCGKTELGFFIAKANKDIKTVYFCLEIPEETILTRRALRKNGLSWEDVDYDNIPDLKKDSVRNSINYFKKTTKEYLKMVSISEQPNVEQILNKMELEKGNKTIFIIDNLGKIKGDDNENIKFADISAKLQTFAYNNKCRVILQHHTIKPMNTNKTKEIGNIFQQGLFGPYGFRGSQKIYDNATRMNELHRDYENKKTLLLQYKHTPTDTRGLVELVFNKGEYEQFIP